LAKKERKKCFKAYFKALNIAPGPSTTTAIPTTTTTTTPTATTTAASPSPSLPPSASPSPPPSASPPWSDQPSASLDLTTFDTELKGFHGGFADGGYGYLVPHINGNRFGKVARFLLSDFSTVSALDLTGTQLDGTADSDLVGFIGGFTDGTHGYLVPYFNGKVVRFQLSTFSSIEVLYIATHPHGGFYGGFTDGLYGYLVPNAPTANNVKFGKVVRFALSSFSTYDELDLTAHDMELKGFMGGFTDGTHGYLVPNSGSDRPGGLYCGKVARFDLSTFSIVEALDLEATDSDLEGFESGFTDGTYGYMVPFHSNQGFSGKVARFLLSDFTTVEVLDLSLTDTELVGFRGGFTDGTYGYMVPNYNPVTGRSGKAARFELSSFSNVETFDLAAADTELKGFQGGFTDGNYGYMVPYESPAGKSGKVARFPVTPHTPGGPGHKSSP
jgi:hypothetical protein